MVVGYEECEQMGRHTEESTDIYETCYVQYDDTFGTRISEVGPYCDRCA